MSNDDVNAVVLRLARTLQRCGEDPQVIFSALIGAAATLSADFGHEVDTPADLRRAIDSVVALGDLGGFRDVEPVNGTVVPFRRARVA